MAYDEVPTAEAIDLVRSLPDGSAWVAATHPLRAWDAQRERDADLLDAVRILVWCLALDHDRVPEPVLVERPRDAIARASSERARAEARRRVEAGAWEEM